MLERGTKCCGERLYRINCLPLAVALKHHAEQSVVVTPYKGKAVLVVPAAATERYAGDGARRYHLRLACTRTTHTARDERGTGLMGSRQGPNLRLFVS